jgi:hypothetical protein
MADQQSDGSEYEIPASRGIPPVVRYFFVIGVAVIVYMGWISAFGSGTFHVWPAPSSATIPLSSK